MTGALERAAKRNSAIFAKCWRGLEPAAHQYDMAQRVDGPAAYQADFWPRDHGKSEIFCISYPLRRICEDPNVRILIVQKTATEATKTLGVIKAELESNAPLKAFYRAHWQATVGQADICNQAGNQVVAGKKEGAWQQGRIYVKRTRRGKDPTVEAVGVGGAITGGHFDVIILDDIEDDENTRTDDRIAAMIEWFTGTIMQLREPQTKMIVVGTLKTNKRDIYQIVRESPVWDVFLTGAILSHDLAEIKFDLVRNAEGIVVDVAVRTPDVQTLWPQKWHIRALLLEMVASLDRAVWIREKLNDLRALAGRIFDRGLFEYFDGDLLAEVAAAGGWERLIQVWDTAYEDDQLADWSVCGTGGLFKGRVYFLDVFRDKLELPQLEAQIGRQYQLWQPQMIGIENAASGRSVLQVLEQRTGLPVTRLEPAGRDKVARARAVTPYLQAGRIALRSGAVWAPGLLDEVTMFPDGAHDDQVDMLVYLVLELMLGGSGIYV
jgi:predicted phage terminase large subunit-like protein